MCVCAPWAYLMSMEVRVLAALELELQLLVICSVLESKLGPWQEQKIPSPQSFCGRILYIFLMWNNILFYKSVIDYEL